MKTFNSRRTRILRYLLLATFAIASLTSSPRAQQPIAANQQSSEDRIALYQALLDLTNPWTVMCVAAHPDDEDGTSLIVMRRKYGAHTVSLFSTFGEGGQNAIGPELYEELGAIRARETMAAAEIQGSEPYFLGLKDFGYSKTRDEAFKFWGHEEGLRRMVLEIRKLRPDVIITNHSTTSNDHGQHQATALMVVEAFDAAADPNKFPEQLKNGVTTWQVQRLFVRARGNQASAPDAQIVTIDPNGRDPVRGVVYAEEALRALQQHATQGPWPKTFAEYANRFRAFSGQQGGTPGQLPMIRYRLEREAKGADALNKDSHNFLDGLRLPGEVATQLSFPAIDRRHLLELADNRDLALKALISEAESWAHNREQALSLGNPLDPEGRRLLRMSPRFDAALAAAAGISAKLIPRTNVVSPGSQTSAEFVITNVGTTTVQPSALVFGASYRNNIILSPVKDSLIRISPGEVIHKSIGYEVPNSTPVNLPESAHLYDERFRKYKLTAGANLSMNGVAFILSAETFVNIAPQVEVKAPQIFVTSPQSSSHQFTIELTNNTDRTFSGRVVPKVVPACESIACKEAAFETSQQLQRLIGKSFTLAPAETMKAEMSIPLASLTSRQHGSSTDRSYKLTFRVVSRSSEITGESPPVIVAYSNAQVARGLRVGYVRGFDFSLPNALNALGVESKELSVDEVKTADLSKFTSIIVDNRVYESKPELIAANQKLLDYANAGGMLIVFYHKSDEWNPDQRRNRPQLAPYKLILDNERITDENAPITFIEPDHPLLNTPNKMGQEDFKDWIQERGLYYPREWDAQFHALLESRDFNEPPLKGGLLVADYGRGHYIYTSMVWYRQLRAGVPGAYRMLANMISYGRQK
jgi:LmbE family N-acetylglucosaminyl deacetylase